VGKSTLFNRLTRSSQALVDDQPGVTRDRLFGAVTWEDRTFLLADTGGLIGDDDDLGQQVRRQAEAAVADADLVLLVMDGKYGPQPGDDEVVAFLRTTGKPVLLVVNKVDHPGREEHLAEFYRFGLDPLYPVAAVHGLGIATLLEALVERLPSAAPAPAPSPGLKVAILGRPNVGKSSFVNRILGQERLIVSPLPGTTRDAIDTPVTWLGRDYVLIDTAGIRRKSHVAPGLEQAMVIKSFKALDRADVAVLLLDATEGLTLQDTRLAGLIDDAGKGCLICLNKWDLAPQDPDQARRLKDNVAHGLEFMAYAPILPISVVTGYQIPKVFRTLDEIHAQSSRRAGTGQLNQLLAEITAKVRPPLFRHRPVKFYFLTQPETHPPTFVFFTNHPEGIPHAYRRYLVKQLRQALDIPLAPVRIFLKKRQRR
jgi:GTP-binding protein